VTVEALLPFDADEEQRKAAAKGGPVDEGVRVTVNVTGSQKAREFLREKGYKGSGNSDEVVSLAVFLALGDVLGAQPDPRPDTLLEALGRAELEKMLRETGNSTVELLVDFGEGGEGNNGRILIELFAKPCPKTASHFESLWVLPDGKTPTKGVVRRVSRGDFTQFEALRGIEEGIQDETFSVPHDRPGIVGMLGAFSKTVSPDQVAPHSATQQFYITHRTAPAFDRRFVAFGRVVDGFATLARIQEAQLTAGQAPQSAITVTQSTSS
jgi:cyclophilin family peptidyl-prolyl cis-trans isomerase